MTFGDLGDLKPWDAGRLRAHQLSAYSSTQVLKSRLDRARMRRGGLLCWILASRRSYLDGLISGLQHELAIREQGHSEHAKG